MADDEHLASLAMFIKVSALVGDQGFKFEYGGLKVSVLPASKVNSPPDKGSWRRSGAAPATTKAPYKHPRAASTRLPEPNRCSLRQLSTPRTASPRSGTNLALLTRRRNRASAAVRGARRLTLLRLRPRRHYRRCRRAAMRRGCRPACGWAGRGCGAATWPRRGLHEAEGAGSRGVPIEWTSLG